mgnify:CR=1 FL=1|jgi:hypothetical protein
MKLKTTTKTTKGDSDSIELNLCLKERYDYAWQT